MINIIIRSFAYFFVSLSKAPLHGRGYVCVSTVNTTMQVLSLPEPPTPRCRHGRTQVARRCRKHPSFSPNINST